MAVEETNKATPKVNIDISRRYERTWSDENNHNYYDISTELLFREGIDKVKRRIVFDAGEDKFIVREYDPKNEKEAINHRKPTHWETLALVESGLEALTTSGFLENHNVLSDFDPEYHIRRMVSRGIQEANEGAESVLGRIREMKQKYPLREIEYI